MGPVNDYVSSIVVAQLLFLQSESAKKPIHLYINSPGGSVTAGLAIYDTMQYVLPPICKLLSFCGISLKMFFLKIRCYEFKFFIPAATWCVGQASSMGSLLLASGTAGIIKKCWVYYNFFREIDLTKN